MSARRDRVVLFMSHMMYYSISFVKWEIPENDITRIDAQAGRSRLPRKGQVQTHGVENRRDNLMLDYFGRDEPAGSPTAKHFSSQRPAFSNQHHPTLNTEYWLLIAGRLRQKQPAKED